MKTPEQMAEEHANIRCPEQGPEFIVWCMCRDDFLAGYKAAKPQWISIHDELPKTSDDVLWCNPSSKMMIVSAGNPKFYGNLNEQYFTHWMPLPEVPKHDKE